MICKIAKNLSNMLIRKHKDIDFVFHEINWPFFASINNFYFFIITAETKLKDIAAFCHPKPQTI